MIENPIYGGAYAYGKTGAASDGDGACFGAKRRRKAREAWLALLPNSHDGYVSWDKAELIRRMVSENLPTSSHHGAPKYGDGLLAGLIRCRRCGRKLTSAIPPPMTIFRATVAGAAGSTAASRDALRSAACVSMTPSRQLSWRWSARQPVAAAAAAQAEASQRRDQVRDVLMRDLEVARYTADRAFRQYDAATGQSDGRGGIRGPLEPCARRRCRR